MAGFGNFILCDEKFGVELLNLLVLFGLVAGERGMYSRLPGFCIFVS